MASKTQKLSSIILSDRLTATEKKSLQTLTDDELARVEIYWRKLLARDNPFLLIDDPAGVLREPAPCLTIKTKTGELAPLVLNRAQRHILRILMRLWGENKPIRLIVLKARQIGSTTSFMAVFYAVASQLDGQGAAVVADEKGKANEIFEMAKLFYDRCPAYLRPALKKSNERKIEFDEIHSQIVIDTAENKDAGRSSTLRMILLSEYAYYRRANADAIMLGISHSVPALPRTMIVKETTANGYNHFKDEWDRAVAGQDDYVPIFVPWYWDEGYRIPVDQYFVVGDPAEGDVSAAEPELYRQLSAEGIDFIEERLMWRRWDIKNNCKGDIEKFKQENPSTPAEAFLASGQCFFDQKKLVAQLDRAKPPLFRANIVKDNFKWVARKCPDGDFMFWEEPDPYGQYAVGGDAASGSGSDYSCLVARDKSTKNVVAIFHAKCDPDELAYRAMCLGLFLNNAKVAVENDKFGFAANQKLISIYGNVYVRRTYDKLSNKTIETFGWDTTAATRPMILSQLQQEIREGVVDLRYAGTVERPGLIRECLTFIKNPDSGKAEAEDGKNDDTVIACAIAGQMMQDDPYRQKVVSDVESRRSRADNMVRTHNMGLGFVRRRE